MRPTILIAAFASIVIGSSFAQTPRPATPDPGKAALPRIDLTPLQSAQPANQAIKTTEGNNPGAPVPGANSFTEGQAKAHIESRGYANVTDLGKDAKGFWRGKATKEGRTVAVTLDYQGNVVAN